jgi:hypothetical protein
MTEAFERIKTAIVDTKDAVQQNIGIARNNIMGVKDNIVSGVNRVLPTEGVQQVSQNISGKVSSIMQDFDNNEVVKGSKEFIQSNSLVSKIAFLFLVILIFILLMRIGGWLLSLLLGTPSNPVLFKGMKDASTMTIIPQNPSLSSSIPILRSVDESKGIEFTYSFWMFIRDWDLNGGRYKHVFHKGNDNMAFKDTETHKAGIVYPNNAPGVYLHPEENKMVVIMNTFNDITEEVVISNIPLRKWINVIIRVEGTQMDVYVNGTIATRHVFGSIPRQNYGDVYINMNGGYNGYFSQLQYFKYGLSIREIQNMTTSGANMSMSDNTMSVKPPYFSLRWYTNQ